MRARPVGVTIVAILAILAGLGYLLGALSLFGVSALAAPGLQLGGLAGAVGVSVGIVLLVMAALDILIGVGALMLKRWAWWLGVVLFGVALVANLSLMFTAPITAAAVIMTIISAVVLIYMFTDSVRAAFGFEQGYYGTRHGGGPVVHT